MGLFTHILQNVGLHNLPLRESCYGLQALRKRQLLQKRLRERKTERKCKDCGRNFTEGDRCRMDRTKEKAVCYLLYAMGRTSMRFLADIFKVSIRTILRMDQGYGRCYSRFRSRSGNQGD